MPNSIQTHPLRRALRIATALLSRAVALVSNGYVVDVAATSEELANESGRN